MSLNTRLTVSDIVSEGPPGLRENLERDFFEGVARFKMAGNFVTVCVRGFNNRGYIQSPSKSQR